MKPLFSLPFTFTLLVSTSVKTEAVYINDAGSRVCAKYTPSSTGVTKSGNWQTGALRVALSTDEDGITTETYTDLRGNAVCVKHGGKATYYVYDDYGDLRYILTPTTPTTRQDA